MARPYDMDKQLGTKAVDKHRTWVQTDRKAHEAWARMSLRKPRAAALMHHLVARMGNKNAVVVSQKVLAKLVGAHVRTIQRAIDDLVKEKWIEVVKLNGPGSISAYVVNDRVAWGQNRSELRLSLFSANVIADAEDQDDEVSLRHDDLRRIPMLFSHERQLPSGDGEDPPSQSIVDGFEPDLPVRVMDDD